MIPFNKPCKIDGQQEYIGSLLAESEFETDSTQSIKCQSFFQEVYPGKAFLTGSCTQAIEAIAFALDIGVGDRVICPSFTFVSCALPFANFGASIDFIDIRADTLSLDSSKVEDAIDTTTKAVIFVHYGGVSNDLSVLRDVCDRHGIVLIEDCAHCPFDLNAKAPAGNYGDFSVFSWHYTKYY